MQGLPQSSTVTRPGVYRAFAIAVHTVALLVLVQAVLAGRGQFVNDDFLAWHELLGNLTWLLALAQLVLVFLAGIGGRLRAAFIGSSVLLFLLMTAQIGLGYAGRDSGEAAALHLPNGVLIFGIGTFMISLVARARRERSA